MRTIFLMSLPLTFASVSLLRNSFVSQDGRRDEHPLIIVLFHKILRESGVRLGYARDR